MRLKSRELKSFRKCLALFARAWGTSFCVRRGRLCVLTNRGYRSICNDDHNTKHPEL